MSYATPILTVRRKRMSFLQCGNEQLVAVLTTLIRRKRWPVHSINSARYVDDAFCNLYGRIREDNV
ncbi:hypothetical protein PR048_010173 [Dryococelus australis]|uniref:Uncharacterized protein n=1 Tax=Dryococelus australis TaxID=614101 RepID=A0ABQ9I301_9NEOP|nr:hypothetical protein PR048_010173 [Dryococelus australis]